MTDYDRLEDRWRCDDPAREHYDHEFNAQYDRWDGWGDDGGYAVDVHADYCDWIEFMEEYDNAVREDIAELVRLGALS